MYHCLIQAQNLGCRPHITSFCDLWVKCITSQHVTHKAGTAVWAAPGLLVFRQPHKSKVERMPNHKMNDYNSRTFSNSPARSLGMPVNVVRILPSLLITVRKGIYWLRYFLLTVPLESSTILKLILFSCTNA